ncbi:MAG: transketolase, partial [Deltaproteobacteria bacterium]|nr:transketolase [Deltaproteobacteria bacterium]
LARPSISCVRTIIGYGSPNKQGTYTCHGSPLGAEEIVAAKENLGWPANEKFFVPEEVKKHMLSSLDAGKKSESEWQDRFNEYESAYPEGALEFERIMEGRLPDDWDSELPEFEADEKGVSTRKASEAVLQGLASKIPELIGGSADLNPSTLTWLKGYGDFQSPTNEGQDRQGAVGHDWSYAGRNIHFGVREHAMGAVASGMALHGGIIPFTGTFFTFSDYMRPSIRLAALMGLRVIYVFSHDSIGVGEDGPTHQPVEHLMSLRNIPNLTVLRPGDAEETVEAWRFALTNSDGPTALIFTRQNLPVFDRAQVSPAEGLRRGGYILWESEGNEPSLILIGTGSELYIALEAARILDGEGLRVRVVSLPSWEAFDKESEDYRESVLPSSVKARVAVEAGIKTGWEHYVGIEGAVIGMDGFGASAPAPVLFEKFGITSENILRVARSLIKKV